MLNIYKKTIKEIYKRNVCTTVSDIIYNKFIEHNITDVFMYSGGAIMPLINKFNKINNNKIKYYIGTHEQSICHSATSYARVTGKTGVVITTSGPGLTNSITGMLDAQNDSTPLLIISGQVSQKDIGTLAFQEAPSVDITKPFTKLSYQIKTPEEIHVVMDHAFYLTQHKKKGVVHLDLPKNIAISKINNNIDFINKKNKNIFNDNNDNIEKQNDINKIISIIFESKKPILILGQGANKCSKKLLQLINKYNIPFTTTIHGKGIVDEYNKNCLGFIGMHGNPIANNAVQQADCIIGIGYRFDDRTTGNTNTFASNANNIINVNIEPNEINKTIKSNINYIGDSNDFLNELFYIYENEYKHNHNISNTFKNNMILWNNNIKDLKIKYKGFQYNNDNKLRSQYIIENLNELIKEKDYIITTGVGNHQMYTSQYIKFKNPNTFITSGSLGVMGVGLPFAIGAKIANPKKIVIDIDGDASFLMTGNELATISKYNLDIKIFIINNKCQAMVKSWEKLFFNERYTATDLSDINVSFVKLADAYNIKSIKCDKKENIIDILTYAINYKGPILIEFLTEFDLCLPLVCPGESLNNMILYNNENNLNIDNILPPN